MSMTEKLSGACHCGAVRYDISGPVRAVVNCHCDSCRKRSGAPYSTYCVVAQEDLEIVQGQESLATYRVAEGSEKRFCAKCGSPLYNMNKRYPGVYVVYYGTLSEPSGLVPAVNVYCESKLPWVDTISGLRSFEKAVER